MFGTNAFGWAYFGQGPLQAGIPKSGTDAGTATENQSLVAKITAVEPGAIQTYADFPKAFSSYNQLSSSYQTYNQIATGGMPLPLLTETATIKFTQVASDTNGPTTETASVQVTAFTTSDVGTASEATVLKAVLPTQTDANGSSTETGVLTYAPTVTDVGTATETATVVAKVTDTDAGAGTDTGTLVARYTLTDANVSTDTASVTTATLVATDTNGALTEFASIVNKITSADQATAIEAAAFLYLPVVTDAGSAVDTGSNGFFVAQADANGTVTDVATLKNVSSVTDAGSGADTASNPRVFVASSDVNGVVTDTASLGNMSLVATDSNGPTDENVNAAQHTVWSDTDANGVVTETTTSKAVISDVDTSVASDNAVVFVQSFITVTDSAVVTENTALKAVLPAVTDASTASDAAAIYFASLVVDTCAGFDAGSLSAQIGNIDSAFGTDVVDTHSTMLVSDDVTVVYSVYQVAWADAKFSQSDVMTDFENQANAASLNTTDFTGGTFEIAGTGTLIGVSDTNGSTVEVTGMAYTVTDVNVGIVEVTLGITAGLIDSDIGHDTETQALRQWLPVTTDTNGATVESVTTRVGLPLIDTIRVSESTGIYARLWANDFGQGTDTASYIWNWPIPIKPGRVMRRTRGEIFKPTTGECEIPGESVWRIARGKTGSATKRTRGEIRKTTTGRILK